MGTRVRDSRRDHSTYAALFLSTPRLPHPMAQHSSDLCPCLLGVFQRSAALHPCIPTAGLERCSVVCSLAGDNCFPDQRARADRGTELLLPHLTQQAAGLGDRFKDKQPMTAQATRRERAILSASSCTKSSKMVHWHKTERFLGGSLMADSFVLPLLPWLVCSDISVADKGSTQGLHCPSHLLQSSFSEVADTFMVP